MVIYLKKYLDQVLDQSTFHFTNYQLPKVIKALFLFLTKIKVMVIIAAFFLTKIKVMVIIAES
ncbi:hypothetical protein DOZ91_07245 [Peribacillus frigoritolerans]|nr:hypothetical protein DOZ91_07245 [Peribacillus frigoritolerans]